VTIWNFLISYIPGLSRPLRYRLLAVNYLRFGVGFGIEGLVMATLAYILKELFGERAQLGAFTLGVTTVAGTLLGLRWASELCLGPGLGRLSDRFGRGRLILGSLPVIVITLLLVGFLRNPLPLIAVLPFMFAATTALSVTLDAFAGDLSPPGRRAFVMSRYATWWDFGAATGPLLGYAIGILFGFSWVYMGAALILILGGILYLYSLTRRLKRETIALDPAQDIP
jgi:MFS family permease